VQTGVALDQGLPLAIPFAQLLFTDNNDWAVLELNLLPDRCCEIPRPSIPDTALPPICRSTDLNALRRHVFQENKELLGGKCAQEKYLIRWDLI
jgi:hypothetical protein